MAGPPYVTDDPEPTDTGHWENRLFASGVQAPGETSGQTGFDINYGAAKDVQLTLLAPLDWSSRAGVGIGDLTLSVKYRFFHQDKGLAPDVAIFPAVSLPTAARMFGPARLSLFLPVWAQKDFGPWSVFGGGGWDFNPGPANRDFTLAGLGFTRQITSRLNLGAELYHQTAETNGGKSLTVVAAGAIYSLNRHIAVMVSGGPAVQASDQPGQAAFYVALQYVD